MSNEDRSKFGKFSRRGMLRGDWFKAVRDHGASLNAGHENLEEVDFRIKKPDGNVPRGASELDESKE